MTEKIVAESLFLASFAALWLAFMAAETVRIVSIIRAERARH
jgi:hypothetical protein